MRSRHYFILRAIQEGRTVGVDPRLLRTLTEASYIRDEAGRWIVTATGANALEVHDDHCTRKSDQVLAVDGVRVRFEATCAGCGEDLGSHRNRAPHPLPEHGCARFILRRRAVA